MALTKVLQANNAPSRGQHVPSLDAAYSVGDTTLSLDDVSFASSADGSGTLVAYVAIEATNGHTYYYSYTDKDAGANNLTGVSFVGSTDGGSDGNHPVGTKVYVQAATAEFFNRYRTRLQRINPADATLAADTIQEDTSGAGVTVDGVLIQDSQVDGVTVSAHAARHELGGADAVDHDNLTNYDADEHVPHSTININSGTGLTGGGSIDSSQTLSLQHLGIENLTAAAGDYILFYDTSKPGAEWMHPNIGLNVTGVDLDVTLSPFSTDDLSEGANLYYTDARVQANRLDEMAAPTSSVSMNSQKITSLADPTADQDAATKVYVDSAVQGLDIKESVRAASTANVDLTGGTFGGMLDGVTLADGDRVLIKDQSTASENGIYTYNSGTATFTRATDADEDSEVTSGLFTFVEEGSTHANRGFVLTTDDPITVDTTALVFTQFSGAGQITAGGGLTKSGDTLDVNTGVGLTVASDEVQLQHLGFEDLVDPQADSILFWDDSANSSKWLKVGDGLLVTSTTIDVDEANVDHDSLQNYVADHHVPHTSVTLTAGAGLTGGGDISANRTFDIGAGTGIGVNADDVQLQHLGLESLVDPNADRIIFWDDSTGASDWLEPGTGLSITTTSLDVSLSPFSTTDLSEGTNLYYTDERVDDRVAVLLNATDSITLTYDDVNGVLDVGESHSALTNNPHSVTKAQVGLGNVLNVAQVENAGGAPSILEDTNANRPAAGTAGLLFVETDTQSIWRDTGSAFEEIGRAPSLIGAADLGFDPATQTELDAHTTDTANPHSVTVAQTGGVDKTGDSMSGALDVNAHLSADTLSVGTDTATGTVDIAGTGSVFLSAPTAAPADGDLDNQQFTIYLDEVDDRIAFKWKESGGTVLSQTVGVAANAAGQGTWVQFNTGNSFDASSDFTYDDTAKVLALGGDFDPQTDDTHDIGSAAARWANVYATTVHTGDIHLANENGEWKIEEGEDDLFIQNCRTGQWYKFNLEAV